jgi:hypothetical protein
VLRWWGRWLPTPQNSSAVAALPAGQASSNGRAPHAEPLTVQATRLP